MAAAAYCSDITWPLAVTLLIMGASAGAVILALASMAGDRTGVRERDDDTHQED